MHPHDEAKLMQCVKGLTERRLMPTKQMLEDLGAQIIERKPLDSWVTDFTNCSPGTPITAWTTPMEEDRRIADCNDD